MSYNLWKGQALDDLPRLVDEHPVDILCVQEALTHSLPDTLGDLSLTASTGNERLGLAVYTRASRFAVEETRSFSLVQSFHDRLLGPTPERLVGARLVDTTSGETFVVASFHAAPLSARNATRRKQIDAAHAVLRELGALPTVMIGDFNYPWFARALSRRLARTGYTLSRGAASTYHRFPILRGTFDLVTSRGLGLGPVRTLAQSLSDHLPIVVTAAFADAAGGGPGPATASHPAVSS